MIVVTGGAGFIGSCLIRALNDLGHQDIMVVDAFDRIDKVRNLGDKQVRGLKHRDDFLKWLKIRGQDVELIYHLGARTDTTEKNKKIFDELNIEYSKSVWLAATKHNIPLVYASSAATYGDGSLGYRDDHDIVSDLVPLNPYGASKNDFDIWALQQTETPPLWYGLKFFNVFGPNEYHKGRMASVVWHAFRQIKQTGGMKLFRSHRAEVANGMQSRDFIYIKDLLNLIFFFAKGHCDSGLYNCGTGKARSFLDLTTAVFTAQNIDPVISFIDTPEDIRDTYQYFTEADMKKVRDAGYAADFYSLEESVQEYVQAFLTDEEYY